MNVDYYCYRYSNAVINIIIIVIIMIIVCEMRLTKEWWSDKTKEEEEEKNKKSKKRIQHTARMLADWPVGCRVFGAYDIRCQ